MFQKVDVPTWDPEAILFNADCTLVATVNDSSIRLWDAHTWSPLGTLSPQDFTIEQAAFTSDPHLLVTKARWANQVQVWDVRSLGPVHTLEVDRTWQNFFADPLLEAVAVLADRQHKRLLVADADGTVHIYPERSPHASHTLTTHTRGVLCLALHDATQVLFLGNSTGVTAWDLQHERAKRILTCPAAVHHLAVSTDGQSVFALTHSNAMADSKSTSLHKWDLNTGERLREVILPDLHAAFAYHPLTQEVFVGTIQGQLQVVAVWF